jgi:hypothetical protein
MGPAKLLKAKLRAASWSALATLKLNFALVALPWKIVALSVTEEPGQ